MTDWITWKGGKCPVGPKFRGIVRFSGETREEAEWQKPCTLVGFRWSHVPNGCNIEEYKGVVKNEYL